MARKKTVQTSKEVSRSLSAMAWKRLKRNYPAMFGFFVILFACMIAILGALIRPDKTTNAANAIPAVNTKPPGFEVKYLLVQKNDTIHPTTFFDKMLFGGEENKFRYVPITEFEFRGAEISVKEYVGEEENSQFRQISIPYLLADVLYPLHMNNRYSEDGQGNVSFYDIHNNKITRSIIEMQNEVESRCIIDQTYWLGTDRNGRDMLSRLMAGTIVSLSVGLISVLISLIIGISLGAIAGYFRGWVDDVVMWLINVVWSIPTLLLVIAVTIALGKGFWQVFVAVGLTMWVEVARIVRGQVLSIREKEFVEAGRALGFRAPRIILRHVLPNVMGPVIVISAANFASAILIESGLSFLGVGVQPPMPSWGSMIAQHKDYITTEMAYLAVLPGIATVVMVLAFMLVGNGLRDALDTKAVDDVRS
ncbi:MAG TPA: ABC transporter permease [Flavobacteriales bacterium]|nr:ABC transporter permease [Flavobacteriales bacterium]HRJ36021.1 ABC transporter permease [Flavobacteriales bacterium]HRJ39494.1 ABC transporter permease [Flavobacteriales bacterium]